MMGGLSRNQHLKENEHLRVSPVVVLTTTDDKSEIQRCYDLGCNVCITKPVNYENFANAIQHWNVRVMLSRSRPTAQAALRGLQRIAQGGIDVVALDHYMPNQDGLETLASIRNLAEPPPVIYVTAMQEGRVAVAALKAGAADSRPLQHCGAHQLSPMANPQGIVRFLISRRFLHVHRTIARRER